MTPAEIAAALATYPWREVPALPGRTNHLRAGVCVPLRWEDGALRCVLTLRPRSLGRHGGEVSFPGGRPEGGESLEETATRECHEEIGLAPREVLGRLSSMPIYTSDWRLEPFVARIEGAPRGQEGEVEEVLELDVSRLLRDRTVEVVEVVGRGQTFAMPIFRPGEYVMFGATALTFAELLGVLSRGEALRPVPSRLRWEDILAAGARASISG